MLQKSLTLFTRNEEEFVNLLIETGTRENVAKILVYLANRPEATFRDIEHGTDVSTPDVSKTIKYLTDRGWIRSWQIPSEKKGHLLKKYTLNVPVTEIVASIEKQKKNEACIQMELIKKIWNYL